MSPKSHSAHRRYAAANPEFASGRAPSALGSLRVVLDGRADRAHQGLSRHLQQRGETEDIAAVGQAEHLG